MENEVKNRSARWIEDKDQLLRYKVQLAELEKRLQEAGVDVPTIFFLLI